MKNLPEKNASASNTRQRILDVAERLFMEHGYEATSMRTITSAAKVNLAAVNYHFGSKETLMFEVFKRRLSWLNAERLRRLDALESGASGGAVKPSAILEAFFGTLLQIGANEELGGMTFLRLLGRTLNEPADFARTIFAGDYAEVTGRYRSALVRALPDVPFEEIVWRFHLMLGAVSYAIIGADELETLTGCKPQKKASSSEEAAAQLAARVIPFLLGGLRAPLPEFGKTD